MGILGMRCLVGHGDDVRHVGLCPKYDRHGKMAGRWAGVFVEPHRFKVGRNLSSH